MKNGKDNMVYVHHMCDAIEKIVLYASKHEYAHFAESEWDQDAVARNLEIIG